MPLRPTARAVATDRPGAASGLGRPYRGAKTRFVAVVDGAEVCADCVGHRLFVGTARRGRRKGLRRGRESFFYRYSEVITPTDDPLAGIPRSTRLLPWEYN